MYEIKQGSPAMERNKNSKYPFALLEHGTYFEVPAADDAAQLNNSRAPRIASSAYAFARRNNCTLAVRRLQSKAVRVFRIK